ncbi:MAG: Flp family type IVb pilin [Betaproteobacteria bacterium]|nr:Flp family type IVb pilin [Betaproteobacteria bacterium]
MFSKTPGLEYGLLAALIALVAVAGMALVGTDLTQMMNTLGGCLFDKTSCPGYAG